MSPTTTTGGMGDWHPTVVNLLILVILELFAYAGLRYLFRSALGG